MEEMTLERNQTQETSPRAALDSATRQRLHVRRKQETHARLQCWISRHHTERLTELVGLLEDSQASLIEQAIDLLYAQEFPNEAEQ